MGTRAKRLAVGATVAAFLVTLGALPGQAGAASPSEFNDFDITSLSVARTQSTLSPTQPWQRTVPLSTVPETRSGAHPDVEVVVKMCPPDPAAPAIDLCANRSKRQLKDLVLELPPGLVGNPEGPTKCQVHIWQLAGCPQSSRIGYTEARGPSLGSSYPTSPDGPWSITQGGNSGLYNVETFGLAPALIGTGAAPSDYPGPGPLGTAVTLRSAPDADHPTPDYGVTSTSLDIPFSFSGAILKVSNLRIALYGRLYDPAAPGGIGKLFMQNPTKCGLSTVTARANSYVGGWTGQSQQDGHTQDVASTQINTTGCDDPEITNPADDDPIGTNPSGFNPDISVAPRSNETQAEAPAGYDVSIDFGDSELAARHRPNLKSADVTLPDGVTLAPGAGQSLEGCTAAQFGVDPVTDKQADNDPVECPQGSVIGDISVSTPILPAPLSGKAYFAEPGSPGRPTAANPWKLYQLIEGFGLRLKLVGDVSVDADGRIHTVFQDLPQTPFNQFKLSLNGGDNAVLVNPATCGPHQGEVALGGWHEGPEVVRTPAVTTTGCADPKPFALQIDGHADNEDAGASSPSHLKITRADGNQLMKGLTVRLPAGLVGSLNAAPLCSAANLVSGDCGVESKVGSLKIAVGSESSQLQVPGSLYLGEPTAPEDVATLGITIPANVGPIKLGEVVLTNHVRLRQQDGGLDALLGVSRLKRPDGSFQEFDGIPSMLEGLRLPVRQVNIDVDRQGFLTNPTGCDPRELKGEFTSDQGAASQSAVLLSAKNCDRLPFSPKLKLIVPGGAANTHKGRVGIANHTPLKAIVTQNAGEASILRAETILPLPIRPDTGVLNKPGVLCTSAQASLGACPPQSIVGSAKVITPLLPQPLTGSVVIVQDPGNVLPKLLVQLRGMASIDLVAANRIAGVRTVNTFDNIPDVPQSRFELNVNGGPGGILFNFSELCENPSSGDATFTAHSGAVHKTRPELEVEGCAAKIGAFSIKGGKLRVSKSGKVAVPVECRSSERCEATLRLRSKGKSIGSKSFRIAAGKKQKVKVKLSKAALKRLRKGRKLAAVATAEASGYKATASLQLKAAKTKKKRNRA